MVDTETIPRLNGHSTDSDDALIVTTEDSVSATLTYIYDGIAQAAQNAPALLDQYLHNIDCGAEQSYNTFPALLEVCFQLRRIVWEALRTESDDLAYALALMDEFEALIDYTTCTLSQLWVERTNQVMRDSASFAEQLDAAWVAADRRSLQLKALNEISQSLSASLEDQTELLELVGSSLVKLLDIEWISIWLAKNTSEVLSNGVRSSLICLKHSWGNQRQEHTELRIEQVSSHDLAFQAFLNGDIIFDPHPNSAQQGLWYQPGCGVAVFPLRVKDPASGIVILQDPNPFEQLRFQHELALSVVNQAAIALQNAHLYSEVRELNNILEQRVIERTSALKDERDRLSAVHEIATQISSTLDLNTLLNTSLELLARITHAEHGSVMLLEHDTDHLVSRASLGATDNTGFTRFPLGLGIAGWVAQHKQSVLIDDVSTDERWMTLPEGSPHRREGSMVAVPLINQGEVLGVLTVSHSLTNFFNDDHLRLLNASVGAISIGVNNANLYHEIVEQYERSSELQRMLQTEARQTEAILQSLSDGVVVCDMYGSVLSVNPAAAVILQRTVEDLLLWNLPELLKRYMGERLKDMPLEELLDRPLTQDQKPRIFTSTIKIGVKMASLIMGPVLKEDGELLGALLVLRDITREIEADRLKTEFIGTMSHELRTPMTAIKGFTQLLAMGSLGPLNETQREFVNTINSNTEHMISLINDVLDITKIESGSVDLELRPLHLAEVLSGVVAELQSMIEDRQHQLLMSIPPGLPLIRADAYRLHQIFSNLLANAVKFTPRNGMIWIEASVANRENLPDHIRDGILHEQRYTQISIRDTGVGIAQHDLDRIFDRFYRTENPLKIEAGGTGLGLSLVKPLVELLGGQIWVESKLNEGSTFFFILPAVS